MDEAVFIAQYTFLATPAVIEEESRILGKIARRLRCEYVIRFEDDGKFYFLLETRSGYEEHFARCGWYVVSQTDFNSRLTIGMGLYESGNLAGFMYRLDSGSRIRAIQENRHRAAWIINYALFIPKYQHFLKFWLCIRHAFSP